MALFIDFLNVSFLFVYTHKETQNIIIADSLMQ